MALNFLLKFLFLAFVLLTNAEKICKHKICMDISEPSQPPEEPPPEEQEFLCPSDEAQFLQHPHDCSKYILCFHRVAHVRHCASGLEWHGAIEQCNTPDQAQCSPSQCPIPDNPNQPVFLYNDNQCGAFALCVNGMPQWRSCAPGFHWDRVKNLCTTPQKAGCEDFEEPIELECFPDSPLRNPHPTDCNLYFFCFDEEPVLSSCATGLYFDYITRSCMLPEDALCYAHIGKLEEMKYN